LKDLSTPERVWQVTHPELPGEFSALTSLELHPHNLPVQLSSFVGRERESAEIVGLLRSVRLLTLTGAGGIGKTRLALKVAAEVERTDIVEVVLVELAPLADAGLVTQTVAEALGVYERPPQPLINRLADAVGHRSLLMVLDNCEHVIGACAQLADTLLRSCRALRILATSREPLGIGGETAWRVPSLSVPEATPVQTWRAVAESDAARLFVERAQAVVPGFSMSEQNAAPIGRLCRRLDGIALALELAAAWVPVLSVDQIVNRLDDALRLLVKGSRVAPVRHQTLRATLDWSYQLLAEPEQSLFERLSVFAGSWTLGSAEKVCAGAGIQRELVLDLLAQLVKKSLVLTEPTADGWVRYRLLEPVRQYAQERLLEGTVADEIKRKHALRFLELAEQAELALRGPDRGIWLDQLEREHDNLRAALAWAAAVSDGELGVRLAGALSPFWALRGYLREGIDWLDAMRALGAGAPAAQAKVLSGSGWLALLQGDLTRARAEIQASLDIVRQLHDTAGIAETLNNLGRVALEAGDPASAQGCFTESLTLSRAVGHRWGTAFAFTGLAQLAFNEGDSDKARSLFGQALSLYRILDSPRHIGVTLSNLASVLLKQGDDAQAQVLYSEALERVTQVEDRTGLAHVLEGLAGLAETRGRTERAQILLQAAAGIRTGGEYPMSASDHAWPEAPLSALHRSHPGMGDATSAWSYDRAFAEAVAELRSGRPE
jgi:predicted ATPase